MTLREYAKNNSMVLLGGPLAAGMLAAAFYATVLQAPRTEPVVEWNSKPVTRICYSNVCK